MNLISRLKNIGHFLYRERAYSIPAGIVTVAVLLIVILPAGSGSWRQPAAAYYAFDIVPEDVVNLDALSFDVLPSTQDQENKAGGKREVGAYDKDISWDNLTSGRPAIIAFWASWCRNCRSALSELLELDMIYHNDFAMVGVTIDEPSYVIDQIWQEGHLTFPNILNGKDLGQALNISRVPTYVLLSADHHIVDILTRVPTFEDVQKILE